MRQHKCDDEISCLTRKSFRIIIGIPLHMCTLNFIQSKFAKKKKKGMNNIGPPKTRDTNKRGTKYGILQKTVYKVFRLFIFGSDG